MRARTPFRAPTALGAAMLPLLLIASGCAGQVGGGNGAGDSGGASVDYGASAEEYQEALADMDPVTLVLQTTASSAQDVAAYRSTGLKESIEELSGGKITIDIAYGPSIAPYTEVDSALVDGRIDLAYMIPIYEPAEYPVFSALATATGVAGTSPLVDELAVNAAMAEIAWATPALLDEFESAGLTPLIPFNATSSVMAMCSDPIETPEDWRGRVVSVGSTSGQAQVSALGATPSSLEYTEVYEALQRNVADCTTGTTLAATMQGYVEVAPHVVYSPTSGFARGAGAFMAGTDFAELPLAARQLVFDRIGDAFTNSRRADLEGTLRIAEDVRDRGGSITEVPAETAEALRTATETLLDDYVEDGVVEEGLAASVDESVARWRTQVEALGYADEGGFDTFDHWFSNDPADLQPYGEAVFAEVFRDHRPVV